MSNKLPNAVGPYELARKEGNLIFCSGQLGINPETGKIVEGGVLEETKQAIKNIKAVLESQGSSIDNVIKTLVLLKDINDFKKVNEIYGEEFKKPFPARSAFQVAALPLGGNIEIEVIAKVK